MFVGIVFVCGNKDVSRFRCKPALRYSNRLVQELDIQTRLFFTAVNDSLLEVHTASEDDCRVHVHY